LRRNTAVEWYTSAVASTDDLIVRDPEILHGTPVFRGTRVPVRTLFDYLEGGETLEEFLTGFPTVSREMAIAALEQARELLSTTRT
jgi:uncharacterized protein (DUF433 family)